MNRRTLFVAFLLVAGGLCAQAQTTVPSLVNYQGKLTGTGGAVLPDGSYDIEFRIWNVPLAGDGGEQLIWGQMYTVTLVDGRFNVILGAAVGSAVTTAIGDPGSGSAPAANDIGLAFTEPTRYMGLAVVRDTSGPVASPAEVSPRQQVLSAPYSLRAQHSHTTTWAYDGVYPPGHLHGGVISTSGGSTWLTISPVECRSGNDYLNITTPNLRKSFNTAWVQGNDQGGRDSSSDTSHGMVYIWAIADSNGVNASDILLSKSDTSPTLPAGYDQKRLLGGRYWANSYFNDFTTFGTGREKQVTYHTGHEYPLVSGGGAGSWTNITNVTHAVPAATAKKAMLDILVVGAGGNASVMAHLRGRLETHYGIYCQAGGTAPRLYTTAEVILNASGGLEYYCGYQSSLTLKVLGFTELL